MDYEKLLDRILELGAHMLMAGAEISRVEDSVTRICKAYEIERSDVFSITSCLIVTIHTKEGRILTQSKRIMAYDTDLERLERCNRLSRDICDYYLTIEEIDERLERINNSKTYPEFVMCLAYILISASFSIFFGGDWLDAVAAAVTGLVIRCMVKMNERVGMNRIIKNIICSASGGLCAWTLVKLGMGHSIDMIIIGNIMLLVPGVALTNGVRDMINGDIISGGLRLLEAVLISIALAVGFAIVLIPLGA